MTRVNRLKIKVCGMRNESNIKDLITLSPDYIGFIFYSKSARYVGDDFNRDIMSIISKNICKVGVFVNERLANVLKIVHFYNLDYVQLHGNESESYCNALIQNKIGIIKSLSISNKADLKMASTYQNCSDYLLFDTKSNGFGGSGKKFDWSILNEYNGTKPFLLSGGINENDVPAIKKIDHPKLFAIDINSRFEIAPGEKDILKIKNFVGNLNHNSMMFS